MFWYLVNFEISGLKDSTFFNYEESKVYFLKVYRGIVIDTTKVITFEEYFKLITDSLFYKNYENTMKIKSQSQQAGIIPTITVPIDIPIGLGFLGGNEARIDIRGSQSMEFGGSSNSIISPTDYGSSTFPQLQMKQTINVSLGGTIGKKLNVVIDHNSEELDQTKNKVRLSYNGEEDEVFQLVELGDASSLQFPSTKFSSLPLTSDNSLFGIRANTQLGPIKSTIVLAREKGQVNTQSIRASFSQSTDTIYAREYEKFRFFYLDETDSIVELKVFIDDRINTNNNLSAYGKACFDANVNIYCEEGYFDLDTNYIRWGGNVIEFTRTIGENFVIGVYYRTLSGKTVGSLSNPLLLKIIKPENLSSIENENNQVRIYLWKMQLKNIYYIGFDSTTTSLSLAIYKDTVPIPIDGENGKKYIQIFKLDNNNDGLVDLSYTDPSTGKIYAILARGYLIFPDLEPFPDTIIYKKYNFIGSEGTKFFMVVQNVKVNNYIELPPDVIAGSVKVFVNGVELPQSDYSVVGNRIVFNKYIDPNANIEIRYESGSIFQFGSKSILGIRNDYYVNENIRFGSSYLMRSVSAGFIRPEINNESRRTQILEFDLESKFNLDYLNNLFLKLPGYSGKPYISIKGEVAKSIPEISTTKEGYIDDMENINESNSASLSGFDWHYGSLPAGYIVDNYVKYLKWRPFGFPKGQIYPNLTDERERNSIENTIGFYFEPINLNTNNNWFSVISLLDKSGYDFSRVSTIEVILKSKEDITLRIDVGYDIPEDEIRRDILGNLKGPNGILDSEDKNNNCILDASLNEDVGFEGDYAFDFNNNFAGTKNNGRLDSEGLVDCWRLNLNSNYWTFIINMQQLQPISNINGWKFYRISFLEPDSTFGRPDIYRVRYIRLTFSGFTKSDTIFLAKLNFKGNRWIVGTKVNPPEKFTITQVNTKENPEYIKPPWVKQFLNPDGTVESEGSLALIYENIPQNKEFLAYRTSSKGNNLIFYNKISYYIRPSPNTIAPYPKIVFKYGKDTSNYYFYEYKIISNEWQIVDVDIKKVVDFKKQILQSGNFDPSTIYKNENYGFKGNPSLLDIRFYSFSVVNESQIPISGTIWINDIRAIEPEDISANAMDISSNLSLGNFMNLNIAYTNKRAGFRGLLEDQPSNDNTSNFSLNYGINLERFTKSSWGITLPLTISYSSSQIYPKYKTGTDLVIEEDKEKYMTINRNYSISTSYRKSSSNNRILRYLIDPIGLQYSYNLNNSRSYTSADSTQSFSISGSYSLTPTILRPPKVLNKEIFYLPRSINFSLNYREDYKKNINFVSNTSQFIPNRQIGGNFSINYSIISNLSNSYSQSRNFDRIKNKWTSFSENFNNSLNFSSLIFNNSISYSASYQESQVSSDTSKIYNILQSSNLSYNLSTRNIFTRFYLSEPNINFSYSKSFSIPNQAISQGYKFRLGFEFPNIDSQFTWSENYGLNFNQSLNLNNFSISTSPSYNINTNYSTIKVRKEDRSFPSITINVNSIPLFGPIKEVITSPNITTSLRITNSKTTNFKPDNSIEVVSSYIRDLSPLLQTSLSIKDGTSISMTYNNRKQISKFKDYRNAQTINTNSDFTLSMSRIITPQDNFPLVGNLRSNLNVNISYSISNSKQTTITENYENVDIDNYSRNVSIQSDYIFSSSISANLTINHTRSLNRITLIGNQNFSIIMRVNIQF
ncbi:MAG: hypothetical protein RMJ38_02415 [candidate division WOR-3 bacterium]|nr:hypothetical protein [candidate division WOR-3 bacterium]MDW8150282.1 hypothetical protein [candidate division WOR-3 bacterium]